MSDLKAELRRLVEQAKRRYESAKAIGEACTDGHRQHWRLLIAILARLEELEAENQRLRTLERENRWLQHENEELRDGGG